MAEINKKATITNQKESDLDEKFEQEAKRRFNALPSKGDVQLIVSKQQSSIHTALLYVGTPKDEDTEYRRLLVVSPYELLQFAHQILEELDPAR